MEEWAGPLFFAASAGNLFLANLVIFRARRARGALPIAFLCTSLFLWDFGEGAWLRYGNPVWYTLRLIGSSLAPAFVWHFAAVFARREVAFRPWIVAAYAIALPFALLTGAAAFVDELALHVRSTTWNLAYLVLLFPFLAASLALVLRRRSEPLARVERNAVNLVTFGLAVGCVATVTELLYLPWPVLPRLGHVGSAVFTLAFAVAILRHRLLEQAAPVRTLSFALLLAGAGVFVVAAVSSHVTEFWRAPLVVTAVAALVALAVWRVVLVRIRDAALRKERLALIGTMAAGVAHEIRNPLAAIKGAAQFVQKDLEATDRAESRDYLQLLVGEVDRLDGVVESFLAYARPLEPRRKDVMLDAFLGDVLRLQKTALPASIRVETDFDADLPPVPADPALLTTAVTNVVRNAVEAMPEGGTLTIRTRAVATALRSWAAIEVADTGPGLPPGERERIFQPFYTTKTKGTGLGLAIAQRILEAHGGEVLVGNVDPRGCRFTFLLPLPAL